MCDFSAVWRCGREGERRGLEQQEKDLEFLQNLPTVNMAK